MGVNETNRSASSAAPQPPPPPPPPPEPPPSTPPEGRVETRDLKEAVALIEKNDNDSVGSDKDIVIRGQEIPKGSKISSEPDSPVLVLETPIVAENIDRTAQLFIDKAPIASERLEGGTRYQFEDGSIMDVADDGPVTITYFDATGAEKNQVFGSDGQPPVDTITFPSNQPDGGTTYSFSDPDFNLAIAQDPTSTPEELARLVNMGLHFDEKANLDADMLKALYGNPALSQQTLSDILLDEGTDALYLQFLENNPNLKYEVGDLWAPESAAPTPLGNAIVTAGGLEKARGLDLLNEAGGLSETGNVFLENIEDNPELANDPELGAASVASDSDDAPEAFSRQNPELPAYVEDPAGSEISAETNPSGRPKVTFLTQEEILAQYEDIEPIQVGDGKFIGTMSSTYDGVWLDKDGNIKRVGTFDVSTKSFTGTYFSKGDRIYATNENGVFEGEVLKYNSQGYLEYEADFIAGKMNGYIEQWNGDIGYVGKTVDGLRHGDFDATYHGEVYELKFDAGQVVEFSDANTSGLYRTQAMMNLDVEGHPGSPPGMEKVLWQQALNNQQGTFGNDPVFKELHHMINEDTHVLRFMTPDEISAVAARSQEAPVLLLGGAPEHSVSYVLYQDELYVSNRGAGGVTLLVDPITQEMIPSNASQAVKDNAILKARVPMVYNVHSGEMSSVIDDLQDISRDTVNGIDRLDDFTVFDGVIGYSQKNATSGRFSQPKYNKTIQRTGNCYYANTQSALQIAGELIRDTQRAELKKTVKRKHPFNYYKRQKIKAEFVARTDHMLNATLKGDVQRSIAITQYINKRVADAKATPDSPPYNPYIDQRLLGDPNDDGVFDKPEQIKRQKLIQDLSLSNTDWGLVAPNTPVSVPGGLRPLGTTNNGIPSSVGDNLTAAATGNNFNTFIDEASVDSAATFEVQDIEGGRYQEGEKVNGQWHGVVDIYDASGVPVGAVEYDNGVEKVRVELKFNKIGADGTPIYNQSTTYENGVLVSEARYETDLSDPDNPRSIERNYIYDSGEPVFNSEQISNLDLQGNVKSAQTRDAAGNLIEGITYFAADSTDALNGIDARRTVYSEGGALKSTTLSDPAGNVVASYTPIGGITGINVTTGPMSAQDMERLHNLANGIREAGNVAFFEDNPQLAKIVDALDFTQTVGLPYDAIENMYPDYPFDAANPGEPLPWTINKEKASDWVDRSASLDWDYIFEGHPDKANKITEAQNALKSLKGIINNGPPTGTINGAQTIAWFMADVMGGSTSDVIDLSRTMVKFAKNVPTKFPSFPTKVLGKPMGELTEEAIGKLASKLTLKGAGKLLGPVATMVFIGLDIADAVKSFREWRDDPSKTDADLAYAVFKGMGGGPGGAIAAAISASQKEDTNAGDVTAAFFAGMFGLYDPDNPKGAIRSFFKNTMAVSENFATIKSIDQNQFNFEQRMDHWENHLINHYGYEKDIDVNFGMPAVNYDSPTDPARELAYNEFYDWYEANMDPSDPKFYPRAAPKTGAYGEIETPNGKTIKVWRWKPGFEPKFEATTNPVTHPNQLIITGHFSKPIPPWAPPEPTPEPSETASRRAGR